MSKLKQKFQTFENAFNHFVEEIGGELISKIIPNTGNKPNNADYFFRKQNIIIELKEIKENYHQNQDTNSKIVKRIKRKFEKGDLTKAEIEKWLNNPENPSEKFVEIINLPLRRRIEDKVRQAKNQIIETKNFLLTDDAVGLIFFADEDSYIPPNAYDAIIQNFIFRRYKSEIDGFVYFITDRNVEIAQNRKGNGGLWLQHHWIENQEKQEEISDFLTELSEKWFDFVFKNNNTMSVEINYWNNKEELENELPLVNFIR